MIRQRLASLGKSFVNVTLRGLVRVPFWLPSPFPFPSTPSVPQLCLYQTGRACLTYASHCHASPLKPCSNGLFPQSQDYNLVLKSPQLKHVISLSSPPDNSQPTPCSTVRLLANVATLPEYVVCAYCHLTYGLRGSAFPSDPEPWPSPWVGMTFLSISVQTPNSILPVSLFSLTSPVTTSYAPWGRYSINKRLPSDHLRPPFSVYE